MLDKIKESVSDVLTGGRGESGEKASAGTVTENRVGSRPVTEDQDSEETTEPESNLYECPACESVFVAIDKETCASCRTPVEQIE